MAVWNQELKAWKSREQVIMESHATVSESQWGQAVCVEGSEFLQEALEQQLCEFL